MQKRKGITVFTILLIAVAIGFFLKNIKLGLLIGLAMGLLISGLVNKK